MTEVNVIENNIVLEITSNKSVIDVDIDSIIEVNIVNQDIVLEINSQPIVELNVTNNQSIVEIDNSSLEVITVAEQGPAGASYQKTFETVSKNLKSYPYTLNYTNGNLTSIVYDLGDNSLIVKTLNYTNGILTSIVLSGDTPNNIELTKNLNYNNGKISSIVYS